MQQHTVRSVLRILAVTTVMVGVILILQALVQLMVMESMVQQFTPPSMAGLTGRVGVYGLLGHAGVSIVSPSSIHLIS